MSRRPICHPSSRTPALVPVAHPPPHLPASLAPISWLQIKKILSTTRESSTQHWATVISTVPMARARRLGFTRRDMESVEAVKKAH